MIRLTAVLLLVFALPAGAQAATIVAGVQYAAGMWDEIDDGCAHDPEPDLCGLLTLASRAAGEGASLVVLPEHAIPSADVLAPEVGDAPFLDVGDGTLARLSARARDLGVYLLADLSTFRFVGAKRASFNSLIAFSPDGRVAARHDKFELFGGEAASHTAGTGATVLDTPFGKVGLLVCADLYGDDRIHQDMISRGARLVAVSSWWTAEGAPSWPRHFARNFGVHVITANTTAGIGRGGGFFTPAGDVFAEHTGPEPAIVYGKLQ